MIWFCRAIGVTFLVLSLFAMGTLIGAADVVISQVWIAAAIIMQRMDDRTP